jgi:hypothetical protein
MLSGVLMWLVVFPSVRFRVPVHFGQGGQGGEGLLWCPSAHRCRTVSDGSGQFLVLLKQNKPIADIQKFL